MCVRVRREHRVALAQRAAFVLVRVPEPGDAEGLAVDRCEPRRDVRPGAPVGFPEGLRRDDAVLGLALGVAEGERLGHAVIASLVDGNLLSAGQVVGTRQS